MRTNYSLRLHARGKPCMVRLEGCDGGGETTVLAHYSLSGLSGRGMKSPDMCGAWCCFRCHELIDGRAHVANLDRETIRLAHAEGILRTINALLSMRAIQDSASRAA